MFSSLQAKLLIDGVGNLITYHQQLARPLFITSRQVVFYLHGAWHLYAPRFSRV